MSEATERDEITPARDMAIEIHALLCTDERFADAEAQFTGPSRITLRHRGQDLTIEVKRSPLLGQGDRNAAVDNDHE